MCQIEWGFVAAWIGALATVGLVFAAFKGLHTWRVQFIKQRDHELALRIVREVSHSYIVFDQLRTPFQLFSDSDVPVPPSGGERPDFLLEHRKMFARYKARTMHLSAARQQRTVALLEALAIWDEDDYVVKLGDLINSLGPVESRVIVEADLYVESLKPNYPDDGQRADINVLYSKLGDEAEDPTLAEYEAIKKEILEHLKPKLRME